MRQASTRRHQKVLLYFIDQSASQKGLQFEDGFLASLHGGVIRHYTTFWSLSLNYSGASGGEREVSKQTTAVGRRQLEDETGCGHITRVDVCVRGWHIEKGGSRGGSGRHDRNVATSSVGLKRSGHGLFLEVQESGRAQL